MYAYRWKAQREKLGYTQLQIAAMLGVHLRTYRRYENLEQFPPKLIQTKIISILTEK